MLRTARLRALRITLLALATLIAVPASVVIRGIFFPPQLDVPSIKDEATYQDPALLARAWQLPVAATYQRRSFFQPNGDTDRRYIVNFQRAPLFARGGGHHSPIAGFLEAEDLVLVLDVNANFKPWLVKSERLFKAVDTGDADAKRGLLRIE